MPQFFYACSECDRILEEGEDFCPDHPSAQVLTVVDSATTTPQGTSTTGVRVLLTDLSKVAEGTVI